MTTLEETLPHAGGFLVSEANGTQSRSVVILTAGQIYKAGAVVQKLASTQKYIQYDAGNSDLVSGAGAVAIVHTEVDCRTAQKEGLVIDRNAEVNGAELIWADDQGSADMDAGEAALADQGIKVL